MKYFGFSSLKNENSPTIEVGLYNNANQEIENFEIGWYDMDLGRGSKAAFIRLKNQFQVWEADADFMTSLLTEMPGPTAVYGIFVLDG